MTVREGGEGVFLKEDKKKNVERNAATRDYVSNDPLPFPSRVASVELPPKPRVHLAAAGEDQSQERC